MWFILLACSRSYDVAPPSSDADAARTSQILTVDCTGGAEYTRIGDALGSARSGDVIRVEPCTYDESIRFAGRSVRIESTGGPDVTTLRAEGAAAIVAEDGEGAGTAVVGFTITGSGAAGVPAVEVSSSSLVLRNDVFTGNVGENVVRSHGGHVVIVGSIFHDNDAREGMVIRERRGITALIDSTVSCGHVSKGYFAEHGSAFVDGSTFHCPGKVAVDVGFCDARVQRSVLDGGMKVENDQLDMDERTVVENVVVNGDINVSSVIVTLRNVVSMGGITATNARVTVDTSIVTDAACAVNSAGLSEVKVVRSDLWDVGEPVCGVFEKAETDALIHADPRFVDRAGGDYRLAAGSPCIDAGPADDGYRDPDDSPNDLGAFGGPLSLGGGW